AYASAHGDQTTAAQLASTSAVRPAPRAVAFSAHLSAATHRSLDNDLDEADRLFALAADLARDPSELAALASQRGEHLAFRRGDPAAAIAQAALARAELTAATALALDAEIWRWRPLAVSATRDEFDRATEVRRAVAAVVSASMRGEPSAALAAAGA